MVLGHDIKTHSVLFLRPLAEPIIALPNTSSVYIQQVSAKHPCHPRGARPFPNSRRGFCDQMPFTSVHCVSKSNLEIPSDFSTFQQICNRFQQGRFHQVSPDFNRFSIDFSSFIRFKIGSKPGFQQISTDFQQISADFIIRFKI